VAMAEVSGLLEVMAWQTFAALRPPRPTDAEGDLPTLMTVPQKYMSEIR